MTPSSAMNELRKMQPSDLEREVAAKRMQIAKMRIGVEIRQEKDTAKFRREKKELARMLTVLRQKRSPSRS